MVALVVDTFGGEFPSLAARNLPPTGAQTALDLLATSPEFRPVLDHTTATNVGVNNPKTLYRLQRTPTGAFNDNFASGWIANAEEVNYVKGQLNDDLTERTYYTIGDGTEPPRVLTATGENRRLGVPKPTTAPTAVVTVVDEFTQDDVEALPEVVVKAVLASLTPAFLGPAADPTENYYKAFKPVLYRVYQTDGLNGRIVNAFTGAPEQYVWALDPALNGQSIVDGGLPYYALSVTAYASWYTVNTTGLRAALEAIEAPGADGEPPVKYLTTTQIDGLIAGAVDGLSATTPAVAAPLGRLRDGVAKLRDLLDNRQVILSLASLAAFYTSAEVVQEINSEFSVFAKNVHSSAVAIAAAGITTETISGGESGSDSTVVTKPTINAPFYGSGTTPNEAGAVAAMTANFNSNFVAGTDGIKRLKVGAVTEFLYDGLKAVASQLPEPSRSEQLGRLQSFDAQPYAAALASRIGPERWRSRPDWAEIDAGAQAAAFKSLRAEVEAEVRTLEDYARAVADGARVRTLISDFRLEQNLDAGLPVVARIVDTRFYIATYVTDWDEESQISPVSELLEVDQNDTVVVTIPGAPSGRNINRWRLYRSNVGSQTAAFQFVDEGPINSLTYSDTKKNAELQEPCPSITWAEPPENLQGLVGMPNGIMAGFFGNTVCFCEPFVPYAWPLDYQITTEHPIVGLGVFGQTLVVVTRANPYFITGPDSASMSAQKMESNHAGVARRSIVTIQGGVLYAGADGICLANQNGVQVVSKGYWLREDWIALNPSTIFAVEHEGVYVFRLGNGTTYAMGDGKLVELVLPGSAFYVDRVTDTLYVADGTAVRAAFTAAGHRTARWLSKKVTLPQQQPLAWWKVYSDFAAPVTLRWYGDGELRHTATFNSLEPQRLPPGRWLEHEVEIESSARVTKIALASTTQELQSL